MNKNVLIGGVAAAVVSLTLVGCGSDSGDSASSSSTTTSSSSEAETTSETTSAAPTSAEVAANYTIVDYIRDEGITETPVAPGDPGSPTIDLFLPEGWEPSQEVPEYAYAAIYFPGSVIPDNPPRMQALVSLLTGPVDPAKILEYAPGELPNLPGYEPTAEPTPSTLSGFDAVQLAGVSDDAGARTVVAQKTVVIPAADGNGFYVLQINGFSSEDEQQILMDGTNQVDSGTTIAF